MKLYIREQNSKLNELAYYGPFEESEIEERLNDAFADYMASGLANIDAVLLSVAETSSMYINPRDFWMSQLATLTDIREISRGNGADECYAPDGTFYEFGRCDTCGAPCTKNGCEKISSHTVAYI